MRTTPLIRIVDDDEGLAESFQLLLHAMGWEARLWTDGQAFLAEDDLEGPGCILLDVRMPGLTGLEVQAALEAKGSNLPIIFLSAHGNIAIAVQALKHGADDFLEKPVEPLMLLQRVSAAVTRSTAAAEQARAQTEGLERFARLTGREKEIVDEVLHQNANKDISRHLGIEVSTVKMHRANAFAKLGVRSPAELIELAYRTGYAQKESS